ncbi:MAG: tetratricopeptide repeat protein [Actinobacteria bacterium]|nr:tetratricopeptide repeat protein [Actinomycetota bacterium]
MNGAYDFFEKGKKLLSSKEFLRAIMFLEKAKEMEPHKSSIRESLAQAYYNCGLYESARENFEKVLEIDATNDYAHYGLGLCLLKKGKIEKAMGHIKMAVAMKPGFKLYRETLEKLS